jgi:hypothetical protein
LKIFLEELVAISKYIAVCDFTNIKSNKVPHSWIQTGLTWVLTKLLIKNIHFLTCKNVNKNYYHSHPFATMSVRVLSSGLESGDANLRGRGVIVIAV